MLGRLRRAGDAHHLKRIPDVPGEWRLTRATFDPLGPEYLDHPPGGGDVAAAGPRAPALAKSQTQVSKKGLDNYKLPR